MSDELKSLQRRVRALEDIVEQLVDVTGLRETVDRQREQAAAERAPRGAATREAFSKASKAAHDVQQRRSRGYSAGYSIGANGDLRETPSQSG